jgi:hypothetical protein
MLEHVMGNSAPRARRLEEPDTAENGLPV